MPAMTYLWRHPNSGVYYFLPGLGNAYGLRQAILTQILYCKWMRTEAGEWVQGRW
jgi:hypothetical protein